ncbi:MAG: DUF2254 domain-containing protein [Theionarchaea archaeon]|nr:DUF2254 domain-containing protein [Theionarchaea archaeon]
MKNPRLTYVIPIVSVILLLLVFFKCSLFSSNADSARYMLSALVQSEAAIIAIVITLSLVAVQLASASYSPRAIQVFKKAPDLWVLTSLYIVAIASGLAVLKIVDESHMSDFEPFIALSYFLGIFCFTLLIPYIYRMFYLLKPETIINKLSEEIDIDSLTEEDYLRPIMDVVRSSLMKYDYETARHGLRIIEVKMCYILKKKSIGKSKAEAISKSAYKKLYRLGLLAVGREDEYSIIDIISCIKGIGKAPIVEKESKIFEEVISGASTKIGYIGRTAAKKGLLMSPHSAIMALGELGRLSGSKMLDRATWVAEHYIWEIGKIIVEDAEKATLGIQVLFGSLKEIGTVAMENGMENEARRAAKYLGKLVIEARNMEDQELQIVVRDVMTFFKEILKDDTDKSLRGPRLTAIKYLRKIIRIVKDRKLDIDISETRRLLAQFEG